MLSRTVDPTKEAVKLADVKDHLRITHNEEDQYLESRIIKTATRVAEGVTGRALIDQTWTLTLDSFPAHGPIVLPKPPLDSVTSITYIDNDGNSQTWSSSSYTVVAPSGEYALHGWVEPAYNEVYPSTRRVPEAVTITFVAGYGSNESDVPAGLQHGVLTVCEDLYGQRGSQVVGLPIFPALMTAQQLLSHWIAWREDLRYQ